MKKFLSGVNLAKVWDRSLAKVWLSKKARLFVRLIQTTLFKI